MAVEKEIRHPEQPTWIHKVVRERKGVHVFKFQGRAQNIPSGHTACIAVKNIRTSHSSSIFAEHCSPTRRLGTISSRPLGHVFHSYFGGLLLTSSGRVIYSSVLGAFPLCRPGASPVVVYGNVPWHCCVPSPCVAQGAAPSPSFGDRLFPFLLFCGRGFSGEGSSHVGMGHREGNGSEHKRWSLCSKLT
jgi:hypothetical protein